MSRRLMRWLAVSTAMTVLLFAIAGRTDLPRLWAVTAVLWAFGLAGILLLDAEVVGERLKRGHKTHDPVVLFAIRALSILQILAGVLDVGRLHIGDSVPAGLSAVALVLVAAGLAIAMAAVRANRFFMPQVRIQSERGHHVVDSGPYRIVRHPGYVGTVLASIGTGLAMGSWLGSLFGMVAAMSFAYRAMKEDRFLHANLPGYPEYASRTRHRLVPGLWVLALLVSAASPLVAQQDTTRPRPFVEGGVYDKPYLGRLLGRTAIGGYAEAHARYERVDGAREEAGFSARRWNIFTATQVSDFVRIGAELEFEEGAEEIKLEYAAIDVGIHSSLTLRAGMLLSPLGKFNLSHDSPRNEFTDRPLVSTEILGVALSEPGMGVLGLFGLPGGGRLTYELYATNGFHDGLITRSPDGTRVPSGRGNFEDNNASPALTGRVAWSPRVGFEVGVSGHHGAWNVYSDEGQAVEERRNLSIGVLDFEATMAGVRVLGEAAVARIDVPPGLVGINASAQRGLYAQVMRPLCRACISTMPNSYFALGARLDVVDFDADIPGDSERRLSLGFNFRPTEDSVLKLDYARGRSRDRFNNPSDSASFLFSVATYF